MRAKEDVVLAAVLALCGVAYYVAATQYSIGKIDSPGPGLLPRGLGIAFIALSLYLLVERLLLWKAERKKAAPAEAPGESLKAPLAVTGILVLYGVILPFVGFTISTFVAVFLAARLLGLEGWVKPVLLAGCTMALCFLVFGYLLDVPLPAGLIWERG